MISNRYMSKKVRNKGAKRLPVLRINPFFSLSSIPREKKGSVFMRIKSICSVEESPKCASFSFFAIRTLSQIQHGDGGPLMAHFPTDLLDGRFVRQSRPGRGGHGQGFVPPTGETVAKGVRAAESFAGRSRRTAHSPGIYAHRHMQQAQDSLSVYGKSGKWG